MLVVFHLSVKAAPPCRYARYPNFHAMGVLPNGRVVYSWGFSRMQFFETG